MNENEEPELLTAENAPLVQVIVQMRIYDVLLAVLSKIDPDVADEIYDAHQEGLIVAAPPLFAGFADVTDE